jgi:transcriptional regulator with XRE-family HTH domain
LGDRFREVRTSRGVLLREVAKGLDVSINTVRWHEGGARMLRVDQLVRAAKIIGVDPSDLLKKTGA